MMMDLTLRSSRLDFAHHTSNDLQRLASICSPATFGLGPRDILDLSYRTALKLDKAFFAPKLNLHKIGLVDVVRHSLLEGKEGSRGVVPELYGLNVYGG